MKKIFSLLLFFNAMNSLSAQVTFTDNRFLVERRPVTRESLLRRSTTEAVIGGVLLGGGIITAAAGHARQMNSKGFMDFSGAGIEFIGICAASVGISLAIGSIVHHHRAMKIAPAFTMQRMTLPQGTQLSLKRYPALTVRIPL